MNLSSLSKVQYINIANIVIIFITMAIECLIIGFHWSYLLSIANFILMWFMFVYVRGVKHSVAEFSKIIKCARDGHTDNRIINIQEKGELGELCWDINDLLDQIEVFIREIRASVDFASKGKFYRSMIQTGLSGQYALNVSLVNKAIDTMRQNDLFMDRSRLNAAIGELGQRNSDGFVVIANNLRHSVAQLEQINAKSQATSEQSQSGISGLENIVEELPG